MNDLIKYESNKPILSDPHKKSFLMNGVGYAVTAVAFTAAFGFSFVGLGVSALAFMGGKHLYNKYIKKEK